MRKFLKTKDILLFGLANLLDVFEEAGDPFHLMSASYKNMYGWIPQQYKRHNFYQLVSRSYKAKFIEKVERDGKIYLRITSDGKKEIKRDFPMLSLQNKKWDKRWRIVMFDVAEANKQVRERLRDKLKELGFGMLQESVFISPHDLLRDFSEFAEGAGLKNYLYVLETHKLIVGNDCEFANKIWKLDELNDEYEDIVDEVKQGTSKIENSYMTVNSGRGKKSDSKREKMHEQMRKVMVNIRTKWLRTIVMDPFLPKMFLPKPWYGDEAEKLVRGLKA
ncbi:MAG: Transcriptional regulator, PaaX family [Candidatus Levybacteria bacterium GW2011_GWB1_37_8]|nr:MAG: Transcriptional regulator, PaaX family [Candidatus Levybacteria bacterium GW2011_GWC2_37_7]KKQ41617.1 MAG: Transcriptional regulator, PaaX family [Candidatus Levybacteria bacterium GW2011_GWB1_37_8]